MSIVRFSEVAELYSQQNLQMHPDIAEAGERGYAHGMFTTYAPTSVLAAVCVAGRALRKEPGVELADGILEHDPSVTLDTAARTLVGIMNNSLEPATPSSPDTAVFNCSGLDGVGACQYAESAFAVTLGALASIRMRAVCMLVFKSRGCQIFVHEDEPILVRKSLGEPGSLSLAPIIINGIEYPPGSLMRVQTTEDLKGELPNDPDIPKYGKEILPLDSVSRLAFVRLTMFGLPPDERKLVVDDAFREQRMMAKLIHQGTISDLATIASKSIK